ncbi:type I restriction-modification protein subunit M [Ruminococcus albus SY3]|uniref:site-specific DNA-methyltransferase (adenine-specific) n=1 Tax=Ruminococcus albus SY3 TaxID=1341156 RepID=A0A011VQN2_RUMAL|nr:type I restriction-modification system subunit M [Ruminococcus albus]EXM37531.1 type I restriction-modification protein subunit M [Ruminococcus albus SY3]
MNKQQLANKIWESANKMRSKIEANEYKDYILGFIFYKFLSDKEVEYLKRNGWSNEELPELVEDDTETVDQCKDSIGYFIAYENLFSTWLSMGKSFDVSNVTDALSAFSRLIGDNYKKVFDKIFDTLQTGLSKLGETSGARTKAISDLLNLIKDIPMDQKQGYDVLGFIYEYLISNFAANAGKKAGEFYTPHEVSLLMSEIVADHLKARDSIAIYDPTSGSGSLLINIGRSAAKYMDSNKIQYYAQELKENTYNLTRMNLVMRGIEPANIFTRNADTLEEDWPIDIESYPPVLRVDAVVSNPPYSQQWTPDGKDSDSRYAGYGLAPKSKADYAFLLHDLYHIKPDGIMTIILPHGVLFRGGEEGEIRKNLIERNNIDAIIGLPANIFFGTGIPTIIMVLKQNRDNSDVLIIDASKGFEKVGKNNKLRSSDIRRIADTIINRLDVPKYSRKVSRDEIRNNDYNLNIPRYVDSSEAAESWDIYASMFGGIPNSEIEALSDYWNAFPQLRGELFKPISDEYSDIASEDIKKLMYSHQNVSQFFSRYNDAFSDFSEYLHKELIDNVTSMAASKEEAILSDNIFKRLESIELIDPYEAYQILDDNWTKMSADIEVIQTEGFDSVKKVNPNMVIKKKNGKEVEVQEGYFGHLLPFELVQNVYLSEELNNIKAKENRISEIDSDIEELFENLDEDSKEKSFVNDDKTAFVAAEVKKAIKAKDVEEEVLITLKSFDKLSNEEKELKKAIKELSAALHLKTKETIENLTDEQANELLHEKWITPFVDQLNSLPENIVSSLCSKVNALADKYKITFAQVDEEIKDTENELSAMINELTGSDFDMQGLEELKKLLGGI